MELNPTIKPALQQFADHLEAIVLKNGAVREDFRQRISHRHFSPRQLSLLEEFASVTLAEDLHKGEINWWATFTDTMKKTITILKTDFPDMQQMAMGELIVFTKWTTQSFHNILNIHEVVDYPPAFPAQAADIESVPVLLAYLQNILVPVMKEHLEASLNIPHANFEQLLEEKASIQIHDRVPGYETLWYAPDEIRLEERALSLP